MKPNPSVNETDAPSHPLPADSEPEDELDQSEYVPGERSFDKSDHGRGPPYPEDAEAFVLVRGSYNFAIGEQCETNDVEPDDPRLDGVEVRSRTNPGTREEQELDAEQAAALDLPEGTVLQTDSPPVTHTHAVFDQPGQAIPAELVTGDIWRESLDLNGQPARLLPVDAEGREIDVTADEEELDPEPTPRERALAAFQGGDAA